jgi:chromosome segregation ATPase
MTALLLVATAGAAVLAAAALAHLSAELSQRRRLANRAEAASLLHQLNSLRRRLEATEEELREARGYATNLQNRVRAAEQATRQATEATNR